jgi:glycerol-3-phosphate cytidylyltransferase
MIKVLTNGVFDLFHIGHLNLLRNAKALGDFLIVAVSTDERAQIKGKKPIIPFEERIDIVRSIKYVDMVVPIRPNDNRIDMVVKMGIDLIVYGDDYWRKEIEENVTGGVPVIYLPYTMHRSTTEIRNMIKNEESVYPKAPHSSER